MKRILKIAAALTAAVALTVSCDEDALTKAILAGEYGVIEMSSLDGMDGIPNLIDENGKPVMVWVMDIDGTFFIAPNRVWKDELMSGVWNVSEDKLILESPQSENNPPLDIVSYENDILTLMREDVKIVLRRLKDSDKYEQLRAIQFTGLTLGADGKVNRDPSIEGQTLQLSWEYDPENYDPSGTPIFTSSNTDVATVSSQGVVTFNQGLQNNLETTITIQCDCVQASVTFRIFEVN